LRLLDPDVVAVSANSGPADALQTALETTVVKLGILAEIPAASAPGVLDRTLAAGDAALRDSFYEAALLLHPHRRRA